MLASIGESRHVGRTHITFELAVPMNAAHDAVAADISDSLIWWIDAEGMTDDLELTLVEFSPRGSLTIVLEWLGKKPVLGSVRALGQLDRVLQDGLTARHAHLVRGSSRHGGGDDLIVSVPGVPTP